LSRAAPRRLCHLCACQWHELMSLHQEER
jgi:hypothetical protein